jgi:hypothetical protein
MCICVIPNVGAQTTSVTIQSSPSHAILHSDGTAQVTVTAQVTYTGFTPPNFAAMSIPNVLIVVPYYYGTVVHMNGTASSTPDPCNSLLEIPGARNYAICDMTPFFSSGTDTVTFNLIVYNGQSQQYHMDLLSGIEFTSGGAYSNLSGSFSTADFYVTLINHVSLTIAAPSQIAATIDNIIQNSGTVSVSVSPGMHTISVPQIVDLTPGSRLMFDHWSDGSAQPTRTVDLEDDTNLTAVYVTQYTLTLTDPEATGSGWYDQNSVAMISVPSSEPCQGILGAIGCINNFQGWYDNGNLIASTNSASITMAGPQTLDTEWTSNMTAPIAIIALIALIVVVVGAVVVFTLKRGTSRRRRRRSSND